MALKNVLLILALGYLIARATATRSNLYIKPGDNLTARLKASGGQTDCWSFLLEMISYSNKIILFFINGQADIGPDCCCSIDIITLNCWPSMLASLGFITEKRNILKGYCDTSPSLIAAPLGGFTVINQPQVSMVLA